MTRSKAIRAEVAVIIVLPVPNLEAFKVYMISTLFPHAELVYSAYGQKCENADR